MAQDDPSSAPDDGILTLKRMFGAPREVVFEAWTDPTKFASWHNFGEGTGCLIDRWDATPGGVYRFEIVTLVSLASEGGIFREMVRPERLVFTRRPDVGTPDIATGVVGHETIVTSLLRAVAGRTELTLRHERLHGQSERDALGRWWSQLFDNLAKILDPDEAHRGT